jgi:pre-mRNA-processing factor 19
MLVALGTAKATVRIFDIRSGKMAVELTPPTFSENAAYSVQTSTFSENGYHLSFTDTQSSIAVWDLRKPKIIANISLDGEGYKVKHVKYDLTGQYIGVAGSTDLRVVSNKSWDVLVKFEAPMGTKDGFTDFAFGNEVKDIWGAAGREVRIWGASDP